MKAPPTVVLRLPPSEEVERESEHPEVAQPDHSADEPSKPAAVPALAAPEVAGAEAAAAEPEPDAGAGKPVEAVEAAKLETLGAALEQAVPAAEPESEAQLDGLRLPVDSNGSGSLYRCAVCGECVFESHLDHHMQICPMPAAHEGSASDAAEGAAAAADESGARQPRDSDANSQSAHGKMFAKRNKLLEELRRKEEEECTFAPKINPRGSPRTCLRSDGHDKWNQRWELQMRNERLKQVEALAYADVTLRPKISRFAQAWSARQCENSGDEKQLLSVFERLYEVSHQGRRTSATEDAGLDPIGNFGRSVEGDTAGGTASPARRRPHPCEVLYQDASERQERLRAKQEQAALQSGAEAGERKSAVLERSRRYYWQMLERQVRTAFEAAACGETTLPFASLEDFLINFGCLRARRHNMSQQAPSAGSHIVQRTYNDAPMSPGRSDDEDVRNRLCAALWRRLDPTGAGRLDLLTVTVFFHVLMGAVDDSHRARAFGNTSVMEESELTQETHGLGGVMEESELTQERSPPTTPIKAAWGDFPTTSPSPAGAEGRSPEDLQAASPTTPSDKREGGAADGINGRIAELLQRFDPIRLRAEFPTLATDRLYNQAMQEDKAAACAEKLDEHAPEIDAQSRAMAAKVVERQIGESGKPLTSHVDLLLWRGKQVEAKKEEMRALAKNDEVHGCTFRPKTLQKSGEMQAEIAAAPRPTTRAEALYSRAAVMKERREVMAAENSRARSDAEAAQCTFRPDTAKSGRSYKSSQESAKPLPRGYNETLERLRAGSEMGMVKRQFLNDRMARVTPCAGVGAKSAAGGSGGRLPSPRAATSPDTRLGARRQSPPKSACGPGPATAASRPQAQPRGTRGSPGPSPSRGGPAAPRSPRAPPPAASSATTLRKSAICEHTAHKVEEPANCPEATGLAERLAANNAAANGFAESNGDKAQMDASKVVNDDDAGEDGLPPVLIFVDVNIVPDKAPERIALREGQSVNEVATEFAARHMLSPVMAQRLCAMLQEVLQRQEQQLLQES